MDDYLQRAAQSAQTGAFVAGPSPIAGQLHFSRTEGCTTTTINRPLSAEGARLVEAALKTALEGEEARWEAEQARRRQEAWDAQQLSYAQQYQNMNALSALRSKDIT